MNKKPFIIIGIIVVLSSIFLIFHALINNFLILNFNFVYTSTFPFFIIIFCLFILFALISDNDKKMVIDKSTTLFIFFFFAYFLVRGAAYTSYVPDAAFWYLVILFIILIFSLISIALIKKIFKSITRKNKSAKNDLVIPAILTLLLFNFTGLTFASTIDLNGSKKFLNYYTEKATEKNDIRMCENLRNLRYFGQSYYGDPNSCVSYFVENNQNIMPADCMKLSDHYFGRECWYHLTLLWEDKLFKDGFDVCQRVTAFSNNGSYTTDEFASDLCYRRAARFFKNPEICKEINRYVERINPDFNYEGYDNQCIVNLFLRSKPEDLIEYDKEKICNNLASNKSPKTGRDACLNDFKDYKWDIYGDTFELDK